MYTLYFNKKLLNCIYFLFIYNLHQGKQEISFHGDVWCLLLVLNKKTSLIASRFDEYDGCDQLVRASAKRREHVTCIVTISLLITVLDCM